MKNYVCNVKISWKEAVRNHSINEKQEGIELLRKYISYYVEEIQQIASAEDDRGNKELHLHRQVITCRTKNVLHIFPTSMTEGEPTYSKIYKMKEIRKQTRNKVGKRR